MCPGARLLFLKLVLRWKTHGRRARACTYPVPGGGGRGEWRVQAEVTLKYCSRPASPSPPVYTAPDADMRDHLLATG